MAFPKNQAAQCMVSNAPSATTGEQLDELGIQRKNQMEEGNIFYEEKSRRTGWNL